MLVSADYFESSDDKSLIVSLNMNSPKQETLIPLDVVVVIDESYSMASPVSIKENSSNNEETGLCIIDIVKHATKTIINILDENDSLSLVGFSNTSRIVLSPTKMTKSGKYIAIKKTDEITFKGNTNIWDGLKEAMNILINNDKSDRNKAILLLTDGVPNVFPIEREHIMALNNYLKKNNCDGNFTINTFGFGYQLDSKLMFDLAFRGGGMYSFIPDASFVGTTFVNIISNLKVTNMTNVKCDFNIKKNPEIELLSFDTTNTIQNEQEKNIVFKIKDCNKEKCPDLEININNSIYHLNLIFNETENTDKVLINYTRTKLISIINRIITSSRYCRNEFNSLVKDFIEKTKILMSFMKDTQQVENLLKDMEGQVSEAISCEEWFNKWGRHYLPSLLMAHLRQQCNNFKDPGIQCYGGEIFEKIRDKADDIFLSIPPPTSSINQVRGGFYYGNNNSINRLNMARFHSSSNPCFHGDCEIRMKTKILKKIKELKKGDVVETRNSYATVQCIVKTRCRNKKEYLVDIDGLLITPYHPIIDKYGFWEFPVNIGLIDEYNCDYVYSIVLNAGHIVYINDIQCVTMGHDFCNNSVVSHPFFGSNRVINQLQKRKGWKKGIIEFEPDCCIKDPISGKVCGFKD